MIRKIRNRYNFEKCRTCEHMLISHTDDQYRQEHCHMLIDEEDSFNPCHCKEWVPKGNLEYLEHLYDKRYTLQLLSSKSRS